MATIDNLNNDLKLVDINTGKYYSVKVVGGKLTMQEAENSDNIQTSFTFIEGTSRNIYTLQISNGKAIMSSSGNIVDLFNKTENIKKLPDSYAKSNTSNNYKLLVLNEEPIEDIKKDMLEMFEMLDIWQATGRTLDLYGDMVGQKRGVLNDVQYRYLILTKIGINLSDGSCASVHKLLQQIFECKPNDIILKDSETSCKVTVVKFPLNVLLDAGFSGSQAIEIIETLLPIGVSVDSVNFDGTFEFAETENEYDENTGFGDIEQTKGGYLGLMVGEDNESPVLPI